MNVILNISLLLVFISGSCRSDDSFDKFTNYVVDYINFTSNYVLPTNNSDMFYSADSKINVLQDFDFIIVGAGCSGTILARRLTENENVTVLLLEAGKTEDNFTDIPAMNAYTRNSPFNWGYMTVPQKNSCLGMNDNICVYPTGKALGGTAVIGDLVYARGNRADYDNWAQLGNNGWSYDQVLPYFKKTEKMEIQDDIIDKKYHGYDGLLPVNYTAPEAMNTQQYLAANKLLGLKERDINGESQVGIQKMPWTIEFNKRRTGGNAFVQPVMDRKNLVVLIESFVTKLNINKNEATGVDFVRNQKIYRVNAKKEVILSAGAINSPQLLMLSGIGPKDDLQKLNISVENDLPVGKSLIDHPVYVGMYIRTNQTAPTQSVIDYLRQYLEGKTPFTAVFNAQHIAFINTKAPGKNPPNVELITINPPTSVPSDTKIFYNLDEDHQKSFSQFNTLTDYLIYVIVLKPRSKGYVKLKSNSPVDFPLIDPGYYTDRRGADIQTMYEAVNYVLNMTNTAPLKAINATVIANAPKCEHIKALSHKRYWYCSLKHLTSTLYHPAGTTRMGRSRRNSVVDSQFKVHNMKNLRVVDAGSMPEIVSGHPFAAVMMMGEKLADILKKEYP